MILTNAKLYGVKGEWSIEIKEGRINQIYSTHNDSSFKKKKEDKVIDLKGKIVTSPFVESHIHLDYAFSAGEPYWNETGTLFEGIQIWSKRKNTIQNTKCEYKTRAKKAIDLLIEKGVQYIRTHVDITEPSFTGLRAILELKEELSDLVEIQIVAFPQEGMYAYTKGDELLEEALKMGADVVGGIPHYEFTEEDGIKSIKKTIKLAKKYNRLIDIHCDEVDDPQSRFLETLASEAYKVGLGNLVTASHTTAMASYEEGYIEKLFKLLKKSEINFIALPKANLHLQGRGDTYPKRRGVTRVKELLEEGMNVSFGLDSLKDPWYPLGDGNLINVVEFGLHVCHMTGYQDIMNALDLVTVNGAKTLNIADNYGIKEGNEANLIVLDTDNDYDIIRCQPRVIYSIRKGNIIMQDKSVIKKKIFFKS